MSADERINRRIVLTKKPDDLPEDEHFTLVEQPVSELLDDHVLVDVDTLSIDAFIRTTFNEGSFHQTVHEGSTVIALGVGRVLESRFAGLEPGDAVFGPLCAQTYCAGPGMIGDFIGRQPNIREQVLRRFIQTSALTFVWWG